MPCGFTIQMSPVSRMLSRKNFNSPVPVDSQSREKQDRKGKPTSDSCQSRRFSSVNPPIAAVDSGIARRRERIWTF